MPQSSETVSSEPTLRDRPKEADQAQHAVESKAPSVSQPGGFANDPDDPTNPNEVIERSRRRVRP